MQNDEMPVVPALKTEKEIEQKAAVILQAAAVESKPLWQSKTVWVSVLVAIAPYLPNVGPLIASNPETVSAVVGGIFALLRIVSTKPLTVTK